MSKKVNGATQGICPPPIAAYFVSIDHIVANLLVLTRPAGAKAAAAARNANRTTALIMFRGAAID